MVQPVNLELGAAIAPSTTVYKNLMNIGITTFATHTAGIMTRP
jgi:hypothetical protein